MKRINLTYTIALVVFSTALGFLVRPESKPVEPVKVSEPVEVEPQAKDQSQDVRGVKRLHGHDGKTEVIIEGVKRDSKKFEACQDAVRTKKAKRRNEESKDGES